VAGDSERTGDAGAKGVRQNEPIEREIRIAASPETVFSFLVEPDRMVRWKGRQAELDPRPGGVYRVDIDGNNVARGEYVEVEPPTRVVFTWGWESDGNPVPPGSSTVEVSLEPDRDGTILRLTHRGLPPEAREIHEQGWDQFLPRLATAAGGEDPGPVTSTGV
jgi:uncharacterized protein YndB with AHSA1/START domain